MVQCRQGLPVTRPDLDPARRSALRLLHDVLRAGEVLVYEDGVLCVRDAGLSHGGDVPVDEEAIVWRPGRLLRGFIDGSPPVGGRVPEAVEGHACKFGAPPTTPHRSS